MIENEELLRDEAAHYLSEELTDRFAYGRGISDFIEIEHLGYKLTFQKVNQ